MARLPGTPPPGSNLPEYTVSDLSASLRQAVEERFGHVRVRGEISQPKRHSSGHVYLRLKDEKAVVEAVIWRGVAARLATRPDEGLEVVCTGRLTTYQARSQYQLIVEAMEPAGEGALLKLLEERRRRLAAEGLFDTDRKRDVPYLPVTVGVITSPTGAVIRDILHRVADRCPRNVLVWPVAVQGDAAADQVARAIAGFNALPVGGSVARPDVLIVARGGGSLEDLMAFNEESVVRAAAESEIPLISAVGHETDTTLIDHAADRRAPTPTAAAEMAVPVRAELMRDLADRDHRRLAALARQLGDLRLRLDFVARRLDDRRSMLDDRTRRLDDAADRLLRGMDGRLERWRARVREAAAGIPTPRASLAAAAHRLATGSERLTASASRLVDRHRLALADTGRRLESVPWHRRWQQSTDSLMTQDQRLRAAVGRVVETRQARLHALDQLMESYSYENVLSRGFVVVRSTDGTPMTDPDRLHAGQAIDLQFSNDRHVPATIGASAKSRATRSSRASATAGKSANSAESPADRQGKLL